MSWQLDAIDWNHARTFLVVAEEGSYSGAARVLKITQPTVGRQMAALEEALDVVLFERAGRGVQLTPTGLELVEHVRAMAEAALRLARVAEGQSLSLNGLVRITASEIIAMHLLPPVLARIRALHPGIELEIVASNSPVDLRQREADIAVRNFQPKDPELVGRKLRASEGHLYATPEYLEQLGNPDTPEALSQGVFLGFDRSERMVQGLNTLGLSLTPASFPIVCAQQPVQWELAKRGMGIAIMLSEVGDAEPRVRRALPSLPPFVVPMWLVSHRDLHTSRRVRVVFDLLAEALTAPEPAA